MTYLSCIILSKRMEIPAWGRKFWWGAEISAQRAEFLANPGISGSRGGNSDPGENTTRKRYKKSLEIGSAPTKFNPRFTRQKNTSKTCSFQ
jgi:hypothetical protein